MRRFLILIILAAIVLPLSTRAQDETFETGQVVLVDVASKPIRSQPSSSSSIVTIVARGDELTILSDSPVEAEGLSGGTSTLPSAMPPAGCLTPRFPRWTRFGTNLRS